VAPNGHGSEGQEVGRSCVANVRCGCCACVSKRCIDISLRRQYSSSQHAWRREFELLFLRISGRTCGNGRPAV